MRRVFFAIMFLAVALMQDAMAQTPDMRRNIGLDSLMKIMQQHSPQKVYYVKDDAGKNLTFTINAASAHVAKDIQQALNDKGYSISYAEGMVFVTRGAGIKDVLPQGYFIAGLKEKQQKKEEQGNVQGEEQDDVMYMLQGGQELATSSNKVYQIGDKGSANRAGKAYVSGYVRDSRTGEPVIGVSLVDNATKSFAQSDAAGFYKILLPVGESVLDVSGYSLEAAKVPLQV